MVIMYLITSQLNLLWKLPSHDLVMLVDSRGPDHFCTMESSSSSSVACGSSAVEESSLVQYRAPNSYHYQMMQNRASNNATFDRGQSSNWQNDQPLHLVQQQAIISSS
ncbi:hypothetical protein MKX01_039145 [Papaver californicum]|nr:hypothetical protein MKX01_039145 [Papaver californicum]